MKKLLSIIIAAIMIMVPITSFADEEVGQTAPGEVTANEAITVDKDKVTLIAGDKITVGTSAADKVESSDPSVFTATLSGSTITITGIKYGTGIVYIYSGDNTGSIDVTVYPKPDPTISKTSMKLNYSREGKIQYWGFPCEGEHDYEVTSSNKKIIDIFETDFWYDGKYGYDLNGRDIHTAYFYACGYGTATITVSDGTYKKTCKVTVPDKRVRLNKKSVKLKKGKKIKLKMLNTKGKVKWKSSKKKVATVNKKGVVKAKKTGTAIITAKVNGRTYKCKVKVVKK